MLSRRETRTAAALTDAVRSVPGQASTPDEERWITRIEQRRAELSSSVDPLTRIDFGAGDADSSRTAEQMVAGVEVNETLGRFSGRASMSPSRCRTLFHVVRSVRPERCVELGTAVGISAAYQAAALELNGRGSLVTLEGASAVADIAGATLRVLGLRNAEVVVGRFADALPGVLERQRPVDHVLIDGHHDERALRGYWHQLLPHLADAALVVVDDIRWSAGMARAWSAIAGDERVHAALDLDGLGVCVVAGRGWRAETG